MNIELGPWGPVYALVALMVPPAGVLVGAWLSARMSRKSTQLAMDAQRDASTRAQIADATASFMSAARQRRPLTKQIKDHQAHLATVGPSFNKAGVDEERGMRAIAILEEQRIDLMRRKETLDQAMSTEAAHLQLHSPTLYELASRIAAGIESGQIDTVGVMEAGLKDLVDEAVKVI